MRLVRSLNQRGDSIVEVLIAIAVIASVLGTSYAIVSRNTRSYQQVNERIEALKIAEGQLESMRTETLPAAGTFCILNDGSIETADVINVCKQGPDDRYRFRIINPSAGLYQAIVEWDSINGGTDQVSLWYRA